MLGRVSDPDLLKLYAGAGIFVFPLWFAGIVVGCYWLLGWPAALASIILLPLAGRYAHHFYRRRKAAWRDFKVFLAFGNSRRIQRRINSEIKKIRKEIETLQQFVYANREE